MQQTKERFFVFIEKLEVKLKEFTDAAVPELAALGNEDAEGDDRAYYRMKSAILGQIDGIRKKAMQAQEEKITNFPYSYSSYEIQKAYYDFRNICYERSGQLEELCSLCRDRIENAYTEDYEAEYRKIMEAYESVRNKFVCVQCGSPVSIDKVYFTTTYITCPACQTRNTFNPGSQAKMLEHLGRNLAEQRTKHLLEEHCITAGQANELLQQTHRLKIDLSFRKDKEEAVRLEQLEQQKKDKEAHRDALYQKYLRAMFDEWNSINPSLSTQHEAFYKSLLEEYHARNKDDE